MTFAQNLLLAATAASLFAVLAAAPASARTICRADGVCFNTSGEPIAPWQQPAFRGGYAYEGRGAYEGDGYWRYRHHHRHMHEEQY